MGRVAADLQQYNLDTIYLERFIAHAQSHFDEFPRAADYLPLLKDGKFRAEIDEVFPKALVATQLLKHQWCLYHEAWDVIWNDTDELFLTSDNPSCLDYEYGGPIRAARYLPLAPRLALWTLIDPENLPEIRAGIPPDQPSAGRRATPKFVRDMNRLVIQSAEDIVLASERKPYIPLCVQKYKNWKVRAEVRRIPGGRRPLRTNPDAGHRADLMVRIAITAEAFDAISSTLPFGSMSYENQTNERGERSSGSPRRGQSAARVARAGGESYSDVILRLAGSGEPRAVKTQSRAKNRPNFV